MVMKSDKGILVVGFREVDSGKTTVALSLLRHLRENGVNVCGFKPKAGNSVWYDFDIIYEALMHGRLYGKDAKLLRKESRTELPEEVISPVHRLWSILPADYETVALEVPHFIADRITFCKNRYEHYIIINKTLPFEHGAECFIDRLCKKAARVIYVTGLKDLDEISDLYDKAIESAYERISRKHDFIVYESYSDNALPWKGIEGKVSLILAVEPGRIYVYDPNKYFLTLRLLEGFRKEVTTNNIRGLIKPLKTVKISPYLSSELIEKMKKKIDEILRDFHLY
ncbi:hypothetical protein J7L29_04555 [Candidatus Bathyarchaeota archaeon]|nr:hypothetical protein [Candidatus Bathyarchaeota archaeon]